ncbi:hypothetical protein [uncultured Microscilla sp.]|uniref:hypothetical protein n=1 Tax=uncultured Microscilla sp. TaxID=432653 RepID=UPI002627DE00|nr:hypothetical protein [uncultured Microscilla sp.]
MIRRLLPVFLLLTVFTFAAQAQKKTPEQKAAKKATNITKYINSKITDKAQHVTATQTASIKTAYIEFYDDKKALREKKKKFRADVKEFKAESKKPQSAENIAKLKAMKKQLIADKKAMNKESKEMRVRREDKIKEALNATQKVHFTAMRAEQAAKRKSQK